MPSAVAAVGSDVGRLGGGRGLPHGRLLRHRRRRSLHQRDADDSAMGDPGAARGCSSAGLPRRLVGVADIKRAWPSGGGDHGGGLRGRIRRHRIRPDPAVADRRRGGPGAAADRLRRRVGAWLGGADDAGAPCDGRHAGGPGPADRATDGIGVLQHLCLADGRQHQRRAADAGDGFSARHRRGVRRVQDGGTGASAASLNDGDAPRQPKPGRHTLRDHGRPSPGFPSPGPNASTWSSCWRPRNSSRSW